MTRRQRLALVPVGLLFAGIGLAWHLASGSARSRSATSTEPVAAAPLPISQVVLFSSGVGYFQREGTIDGNSRIDMTFPVQDINDLLKSMILQDLDGGRISAVSYDSHDPIDRTLKSFAIDLTKNPSFGQVLNQARGEKVEVTLQASATTQPGTLTGTILGVEKQKQATGKDGTIETELLNLWCVEGMRCVKLADLQRVRFLNPVLDNEVKRALEVLALSHDTQKKAVSLNFAGQGKRRVSVGYVVENPIWKTSYRLVMGKDNKMFLQGWAVVENTSDDDWNNVRMALISGRPISFQMDLYQPLYVPRPVVEPELFASLRPPTYSGNMTNYNVDQIRDASVPGGAQLNNGSLQTATLPTGTVSNIATVPLAGRLSAGLGAPGHATLQGAWNLQEQVAELLAKQPAGAVGEQLGHNFQYRLDEPVTLARQKSAMLLIVSQPVEGTRVSIYNEGTHAKFPLHGLKFRNTTGLHLMQGPITVFENDRYAGDSRIMDVQPKEERLLSYAIDLGTEVEPIVKQPPTQLIGVKITKGILTSTTKVRETKTYNVKNRSGEDRTLLIEHPYREEFTLLKPEKPTERSRDVYRFEVKVPAGKTASQEVIEENDLKEEITLTNSDDQAIRIFLKSDVTSPAVKKALTEAMSLKHSLATTKQELALAQQQLKDIVQDQDRLRKNLKEMPPTATAYKRYLEKFDQQETEIEKLQAKIKALQDADHQQQQGLDTFLAKLSVE